MQVLIIWVCSFHEFHLFPAAQSFGQCPVPHSLLPDSAQHHPGLRVTIERRAAGQLNVLGTGIALRTSCLIINTQDVHLDLHTSPRFTEIMGTLMASATLCSKATFSTLLWVLVTLPLSSTPKNKYPPSVFAKVERYLGRFYSDVLQATLCTAFLKFNIASVKPRISPPALHLSLTWP